MKKLYKKEMIESISLICILLFSINITRVNANPDEGFDRIQEDNKYEYKFSDSTSTTFHDYKNDEETSASSHTEQNLIIVIEIVDADGGYITYKRTSVFSEHRYNYTDGDTLSFYFDYQDDDSDKIPESVDIGFGSPYLIAGKWDNFTAGYDVFDDLLSNATDDLDDFDYSLDKNDDEQKIKLVLDYNSESYQDSVIFASHLEYTLDYIDFALDIYNSVAQRTVDSIENSTYLEDNGISISNAYSDNYVIKLQGFWEVYGLWIIIGSGAGIVATIAIVIWKKKTKTL